MFTFFFLAFAVIGLVQFAKLAKNNPGTSMKAASLFTNWLSK